MKVDVDHLAKLAELKLSPQEKSKIAKQLGETLDYIQNLNELSTDKVKETNHTLNLINESFKDGMKNTRGLSNQQIFKNTKKKKGDFFAVKKIL